VPTDEGHTDAVVARLALASARLKALQEDEPVDADGALERLRATTDALDPLRSELGALRARIEDVAAELRSR
jgi:flagellin-like hook-associated protein FlgL